MLSRKGSTKIALPFKLRMTVHPRYALFRVIERPLRALRAIVGLTLGREMFASLVVRTKLISYTQYYRAYMLCAKFVSIFISPLH